MRSIVLHILKSGSMFTWIGSALPFPSSPIDVTLLGSNAYEFPHHHTSPDLLSLKKYDYSVSLALNEED